MNKGRLLNRTHFSFTPTRTEMSLLHSYFQGNRLIWSFHTKILFIFFLFFKRWRASSSFALTSMKLSVIERPQWFHSVSARPCRAPTLRLLLPLGSPLMCAECYGGLFSKFLLLLLPLYLLSQHTRSLLGTLPWDLAGGTTDSKLGTLQLQQGTYIQTKVSGFHSQTASF